MRDIPGMIRVFRADLYNSISSNPAYVAVDSIESIQDVAVVERSRGSLMTLRSGTTLTLRSGTTLTVCETPDEVVRLIIQSLQGDQP